MSSKNIPPKRNSLNTVPITPNIGNDKGLQGYATIHNSINDIPPEIWNELAPADSPLLQHQFLSALENTGCVSTGTGWRPNHLAIYGNNQLLAAAPCYLKYHSYGEYIFDWNWAHAYRQAGLTYYPKLLLAVPFTPITNISLLSHPDTNSSAARINLINAAYDLAKDKSASSIHSLFTTHEDNEAFNSKGFFIRKANQFHWTNHGYSDFSDFLSELNSKKRKNIARERKTINSHQITFRWLDGFQATPNDWSFFYSCYENTISGYAAIPYLNLEFFRCVGETMASKVRLLIASHHGVDIASAFFLRGKSALFGRYWGSIKTLPNLHFETCFYQPIDYCIRHQLTSFEAGAQGEHKLSRGLTPTTVFSAHWLSHPDFASAIGTHIDQERRYIEEYQAILSSHSPYKNRP
ncbi:MAG: GNAT family N-acetyltransferase [Acidiferrobacteraceae bacterium]|mgnify:CR=1 FL=1|nr:GNAT family N-acetyltransferase [Acidiferrobacteraceae bacterium]|tara:strand:+ start:2629 stop:3852 length:1224 start_codon:yes stop_codon:yes gene_type:complete